MVKRTVTHININELEVKEFLPGVFREIVCKNENFTLAYMEAGPKNGDLAHKHIHEQILYIIEGEGIFCIEQQKMDVKAGDILYIPSEAKHNFAHFGTKIRWIEFFYPARQDL